MYQANIYGETPFTSMKKVVREVGHPLFSICSCYCQLLLQLLILLFLILLQRLLLLPLQLLLIIKKTVFSPGRRRPRCGTRTGLLPLVQQGHDRRVWHARRLHGTDQLPRGHPVPSVQSIVGVLVFESRGTIHDQSHGAAASPRRRIFSVVQRRTNWDFRVPEAQSDQAGGGV